MVFPLPSQCGPGLGEIIPAAQAPVLVFTATVEAGRPLGCIPQATAAE
jgi:hypothetical protein